MRYRKHTVRLYNFLPAGEPTTCVSVQPALVVYTHCVSFYQMQLHHDVLRDRIVIDILSDAIHHN